MDLNWKLLFEQVIIKTDWTLKILVNKVENWKIPSYQAIVIMHKTSIFWSEWIAFFLSIFINVVILIKFQS